MTKKRKSVLSPIDEPDLIEGYYLLNHIKPKYFQTPYPYNEWNAEKIIMTQKNITIPVKQTKAKKVKGGAESQISIYF